MLLVVVVNEETPEKHFFIFATLETAPVYVCAHFNRHLELDAAVAEKGEEQPRVVFGERTVVLGLSAEYAAVLERGLGGEAERVVGQRLLRVGDEEGIVEGKLNRDPGRLRLVLQGYLGVVGGRVIVKAQSTEAQIGGLA